MRLSVQFSVIRFAETVLDRCLDCSPTVISQRILQNLKRKTENRTLKTKLATQVAGCSLRRNSAERKVRAPLNTMVDNVHRPQGPGKCNRKQTA